jgi:hypothetical protein
MSQDLVHRIDRLFGLPGYAQLTKFELPKFRARKIHSGCVPASSEDQWTWKEHPKQSVLSCHSQGNSPRTRPQQETSTSGPFHASGIDWWCRGTARRDASRSTWLGEDLDELFGSEPKQQQRLGKGELSETCVCSCEPSLVPTGRASCTRCVQHELV